MFKKIKGLFTTLQGSAVPRKYKEHLWFSYYLPWDRGIYSSKHRTDVVLNKNFWNSYLDMRKQGHDDMLAWMSLDPDFVYDKKVGPQYLGADYVELTERRQAKAIQERFGTKKWGVDIGVRYFPTKEYLTPIPFTDYAAFRELVFNYKRVIRESQLGFDMFTLPQVVELVLAGGPDSVLRGHRWIRRHQYFDDKFDMYILSYQLAEIEGDSYIFQWPITEEKIREFWESDARKVIESFIYRVWKMDDTLQRRLRRSYKWQALTYFRQYQQMIKFRKFSRFSFFFRLLIDHRLQRYKKRYKEEKKVDKYTI